MTTQVFGSSIKRREDPRLITGQGNYVDDIKLMGMLHAAFVRSPHAHANIRSIETSKAEALEGVVAVFTGAQMKEELGELILGWILPEQKQTTHPPMAFDRVRFVGEAVAVVVADSPEAAVEGAELVDVDYETLPVVVDGEKATAAGALRGFQDTTWPMAIGLVAYWMVGAPISWILGVHLRLGPHMVWVGLLVGLTVAALLLNLRYHRVSSQGRSDPGAPGADGIAALAAGTND
ncbi:MAG: hypothetical protein IH956_09705 [Chloroflexi bacterium]|nr:hypothetical protein [Chloroflexota bacterium]